MTVLGIFRRFMQTNDGEPQPFTPCRGCGGATRTIDGRCEACGDAKERANKRGRA
jgi:hypothetical protein